MAFYEVGGTPDSDGYQLVVGRKIRFGENHPQVFLFIGLWFALSTIAQLASRAAAVVPVNELE